MKNYFTERDGINNDKMWAIIEDNLPSFCEEYFIGIEGRTTTLTRLNYARDLKLFFKYLTKSGIILGGRDVKSITLDDLSKITAYDIEKFLSFLGNYKDERTNTRVTNSEQGKSRKLSAIRSLMKYFERKGVLVGNPTISVEMPKIRSKEIVRLENDEVEEILNVVDSGRGMSGRQLKYQENTKVRDTAIIGLLLGTGIRVSELVGIDTTDVDFDNLSFVVTRKGGARVILYFSDEVAGMLYDYYILRQANTACPKQEKALFLSLQNKRITTRAVENIIKKYSQISTPLKHITPHKLRSTFGTRLYRSTGDIYVVADVLGHKDVNTTKRYYAAISDDIRRNASEKVTLRSRENTEPNKSGNTTSKDKE